MLTTVRQRCDISSKKAVAYCLNAMMRRMASVNSLYASVRCIAKYNEKRERSNVSLRKLAVLHYTVCNEWAGPISAALRLGNTNWVEECGNGGKLLATL